MDALIREADETPDDADRPGWWPALATKVERWWPRLRGWGRQLRAATTLLLAGVLA
jgi:hypothetical protein